MCKDNGAWIDSMSELDGLPRSSIICSTWFRVEVPGKIAFPRIISPKMHPTLHMSTAFEYFYDPRRISGALYQRVATYSVSTGGSKYKIFYIGLQSSERLLTVLAKPKSANLAWHAALTRRLAGLRSRWIRSPECKYFKALST